MIYFARIKIVKYNACNRVRTMSVIKIGCSIQVEGRLRELGRQYGRPIKLLATMPGDYKTESAIHEQFANSRLPRIGKGRLDWFYPTRDLVSFVKQLKASAVTVESI